MTAPGFMLTPHAAQPKIYGVPHVFFTPQTWADQSAFVDIANQEIGCLGTVLRLPDGSLMVDNLYMLEQGVSGATTEIDQGAVGAIQLRLLQEDQAAGLTPEDPRAKCNRLKYWFHSHVNMDTGPSSQDNKQAIEFGRVAGNPWFLRGIGNKKGRCTLDLFLFGEFEQMMGDLQWGVKPNPMEGDDSPAVLRYREIEAEIKEKTRSIGYGGGRGYTPGGAHAGSRTRSVVTTAGTIRNNQYKSTKGGKGGKGHSK